MSSTTSQRSGGVCPVCEDRGRVGDLCPQPVCTKRGYRMVPARYLPDDGSLVDPLVGQAIGDYLVVDFIGSGGFGRVYLALQQPIQLEAALKLVDLDWVPESARETVLARFEAEARALALVRHPNVVGLLHYGNFRKRPYMVMEYVGSAVTLEEEIGRRAALGERFGLWEIRSMIGQLLDGLAAAHERNMIHRDIKPGNIMLQQVHGNPLLVRILDFGLAKFLDGGSRTVATTGTPDYMAPEQISPGEMGTFTDLYAAGSIAFELLTGSRPFPGEDMQQIFFYKMGQNFDPTAALTHLSYPDETLGFLRRALACDPASRYRSVEAFRLGFEGAVAALECAAADPFSAVVLDKLTRGDPRLGELERAPTREARARKPSADEAFRGWLARERERLSLGDVMGEEEQ